MSKYDLNPSLRNLFGDNVFALWNIFSLFDCYVDHQKSFVNRCPKTFCCWKYNTGRWLKESDNEFQNLITILSKHNYSFTIESDCIIFSEESYFYFSLALKNQFIILE